MLRKAVYTTIALFLLGLALFAQQPPADPDPHRAPVLSEVEQLKLENVQLKSTLLASQQRAIAQQQEDLQKQWSELMQQLQQAHPGYVYNPQAKALVAAPAAPQPKAPAAKN